MEEPPAPEPRVISYTRVVNLSLDIHPGMFLWPGDPPVEFEVAARLDHDGYYLRRFAMGEHSGTHVNAPSSFYPRGVSIDTYPAESLVVAAVTIDLRDRVADNPDYELTVADLDGWEARNGRIKPETVVLLCTGWLAERDSTIENPGPKMKNTLKFPGFGLGAARRLLNEREVAGLGIDTPGLEPGSHSGFSVNKLLLERPRLALENLTNLDQLPLTGATLVIGLLRLVGGTGSPASVLALIP